MKIIKFKQPYTTENGEIIPELILSINRITIAPANTDKDSGAGIAISVNQHASLERFIAKEPPCDKRTFRREKTNRPATVAEKTYKKDKKEKKDDPNYDAYFSGAVTLDDIQEQSLKFYREVHLVEQGINLDDTEMIDA